jgi:hypothetical protein
MHVFVNVAPALPTSHPVPDVGVFKELLEVLALQHLSQLYHYFSLCVLYDIMWRFRKEKKTHECARKILRYTYVAAYSDGASFRDRKKQMSDHYPSAHSTHRHQILYVTDST